MPRINTPASADAAPAVSRRLLGAVQPKLGSIPNLLLFAARVVWKRCHVRVGEVQGLRQADHDDGHIVEIIEQVGLNTWTNDLNEVAGKVIDFPAIERRAVG